MLQPFYKTLGLLMIAGVLANCASPYTNVDLLKEKQSQTTDGIQISETSFPTVPIELSPTPIPARQPGLDIAVNMAQTVNGLGMTLYSVNIGSQNIAFTLCYDVPSADYQWSPETRVSLDGVEAVGAGWSNLKFDPNIESPELVVESRSCYRMSHHTPGGSGWEQVVISVPYLKTDELVSAGRHPTQEELERVHQRLAEKGIEVQFQWGDHSMRYDVLKRPPGMSDQDLGLSIHEALSDHYDGPWEFSVKIP